MGVHVYRSTGNSPSLSGTLRRVRFEISENLYVEAGWKNTVAVKGLTYMYKC